MIDFPNVSKDARIAVAMSGGVDSSTCVALLQEAGYKNIFGLTLLLYENDDEKGIVCRDQTIVDDCNKVAKHLSIEHYFIDRKELFMKEIINPFLEGYANGITVNPCISCNRDIKYGALLEEALKLGADVLVTGHYIKWKEGIRKEGELYRGNTKRDQSYFLANVKKETLKYMRFPLSNFTKEETREHAKRFGLHVASKDASKDLCFAAGSSYTNIVQNTYKNTKSGNIIDKNGNILAKHNGLHNFTIGQRKGLNLGSITSTNSYFVIAINAETADVTVGFRDDLLITKVNLTNLNWLGDEENIYNIKNKQVLAKVRSSQLLTEATINYTSYNSAVIEFKEPIYSPAKGQVCAFYSNDSRLLGGGFIEI